MMISGLRLTPLGNDSVLLEPGQGLDPGQPDEALEKLLDYLQRTRARHLIYDLSTVAVIDNAYYAWLTRLHTGCQVCGVRLIAVNIRPHAAYALARQLTEIPAFATALDVDSARQLILAEAEPLPEPAEVDPAGGTAEEEHKSTEPSPHPQKEQSRM
jgi:rsbT antagonist protein RsbS